MGTLQLEIGFSFRPFSNKFCNFAKGQARPNRQTALSLSPLQHQTNQGKAHDDIDMCRTHVGHHSFFANSLRFIFLVPCRPDMPAVEPKAAEAVEAVEDRPKTAQRVWVAAGAGQHRISQC